MKIDVQHMALSDYLNQNFDCECGHNHSTTLQAVKIGKDALQTIPDIMKQHAYRKAYLIADKITYQVAGEKLSAILNEADLTVIEHVFLSKNFMPNETALGQIMIDYDSDCDVIIAVGTGSINDLCRFASFKWRKPFFTVATAPPMDGFASNVAALIINNLKTTYVTHAPQAIIGDVEILKNAPLQMITAGLGDTLGKYTCLCDWKLANLINGEYYCPTIVEMVRTCVSKVYANAERISQSDPDVVGNVMEALVLTGIAMSFVNNSRPAAGCEHHLSHFWETLFMQKNIPPVLHGAKVGIGTLMILKIAELLQKKAIDFNAARRAAKAYDPQKWETEIRHVYGPAADGIITMEHDSQKNNTEDRLKRIAIIEQNWEGICEILKEDLPPAEELKELLKQLGAPYFPAQKGIGDKMLWNAIVYAKEIRNRYTILQMVWDLGLSTYMADQLLEYVNQD